MLFPPPSDPIAAVTHPDPYSYYASLRSDASVHRFERLGLWAVVGTSALNEALNEPRAHVRPPAEPVPRFLLDTQAGAVFAAMARMNDGPRHGPQRERFMALLGALSAQRVAAEARRAAHRLARSWRLQRDAAGIDRLAQELPATTIAAAIGLREDDLPSVVRATTEWVAGLSPLADDAARARGVVAMERLLAYLAAQGVNEVDAVAAHVALLMQPHDATAGLIGAGVLRLALDESLRTAALGDSLPWDAFSAEVLRHDPSTHNTRRTLAADAQIGGQTMQAGDTLLLVLAAAERDPARHADPDRFLLNRPLQPSLVLGAGIHVCPAGFMALAIAQAAWRELLSDETAPALAALAGEVRWRPSVNVRMPVFGLGGGAS